MRKLALIFTLLIVIALTVGWRNGGNNGNGFGTHDWILKEAWDVLGRPKWFNYKAARKVNDNPDTVTKDFSSHLYDRWGNKQGGNAPRMVQSLFDEAVESLRKGRNKKASRLISKMSH